jgi:3-deoxy-manno-octulosonate cytidylyltransferase (CMP-KDO synthetase)
MNKAPMVIGVIPSRYASTRLPAKPLIDLCGKTMVQRVYEQASRASLLSRVIVATDHEEIRAEVRKFGGEVMMTPSDLRSGTDRIAYVARQIPEAEIFVNIQGDEPLIDPSMIDATVRPLLDDPSIQLGTPAKPITDPAELANAGTVKVVCDGEGFALYFSRSPIPCVRDERDIGRWIDLHTFTKHIGLYVYRRNALLAFSGWDETPLERAEKLEQLRFLEHGYRMKVVETACDSVPIDTAADADRVRSILRASGGQN